MIVTTTKKLEREIRELRKDMAIVKAAILATDPEGEYQNTFVEKVQRLAKQKPTREYRRGAFSK